MSKVNLNFGDIEVKKSTFYKFKHPIGKVDILKIVISSKISCGENGLKYFTGYKDHDRMVE